jgi:hypothetical protein
MGGQSQSRRDFLTGVGMGAAALAMPQFLGRAHAEGEKRRPNLVIIFTDDQGYADLGCFGAEDFETPNLDRMAAEGVRFTSFYVAQAVCGASRAAF